MVKSTGQILVISDLRGPYENEAIWLYSLYPGKNLQVETVSFRNVASNRSNLVAITKSKIIMIRE